MIWTNSGDSHFLEPDDLWQSRLPKALADLTPHAEKDPDGEYETVSVDGQIFRRKLPSSAMEAFIEESMKPQGIRDAKARLGDLDKEGVWGEVIFPSLGMWGSTFRTPELLKACMRASNEWALEDICAVSPRYVVTAQVSTLIVEDAVEELHWARGQRLQGGVLADDAAPERPGLASQRVGAVLGGGRRSRHGDRVPHRHRPGRHDGRWRQRRARAWCTAGLAGR